MEEKRNNGKGSIEGREGNWAREKLLVDKCNSSSTIPKVTKGNVGNKGVQEAREDTVMREKVGEMRELREIHKNIVPLQIEITTSKSKGGSWKRRACAKIKNGRKDQGEDKENTDNRNCISAKRGFFLVNEQESPDWKKKIKLGLEWRITCENLVEEATHKWPQLVQ